MQFRKSPGLKRRSNFLKTSVPTVAFHWRVLLFPNIQLVAALLGDDPEIFLTLASKLVGTFDLASYVVFIRRVSHRFKLWQMY